MKSSRYLTRLIHADDFLVLGLHFYFLFPGLLLLNTFLALYIDLPGTLHRCSGQHVLATLAFLLFYLPCISCHSYIP